MLTRISRVAGGEALACTTQLARKRPSPARTIAGACRPRRALNASTPATSRPSFLGSLRNVDPAFRHSTVRGATARPIVAKVATGSAERHLDGLTCASTGLAPEQRSAGEPGPLARMVSGWRAESLLLGSTSAEVVDHAPCPVLVARHPSVHWLVIGMDGSECAKRAVATLVAWPLLRAAPASVVGVVEPLSAWDFAAGGATPQAVEMAMEAQNERARQLTTQ